MTREQTPNPKLLISLQAKEAIEALLLCRFEEAVIDSTANHLLHTIVSYLADNESADLTKGVTRQLTRLAHDGCTLEIYVEPKEGLLVYSAEVVLGLPQESEMTPLVDVEIPLGTLFYRLRLMRHFHSRCLISLRILCIVI